MAETLVNRKRFTTTLDNKLLTALHKMSEDTRINISKLIDEAIEDLLKKHKRL